MAQTLTKDEERRAIDMALQGKRLVDIRKELNIGSYEFWDLRENNTDFASAFARARKDGIDDLTETLLTIPDDEPDVQRARLKSDNIKWYASKAKPEVYGDKLDLTVTNNVDLNSALEAARARALPIRDQHKQIDAQATDYVDITPNSATDIKSVEAEKVSDTPDAEAVRKDGIFE